MESITNGNINEKTNQMICEYFDKYPRNFDLAYSFKDEYLLNIERKNREKWEKNVKHIITNLVEIDLTNIEYLHISIRRSDSYFGEYNNFGIEMMWDEIEWAFHKNGNNLKVNLKMYDFDLDIMNIFYNRLHEAINLKKIVIDGVYEWDGIDIDAEYITEEQYGILSEYISSNPIHLKVFQLKFLNPTNGYMSFLNSFQYNTFLEEIEIPVPHYLRIDNDLRGFFNKKGLKDITLYFSIFGLSVKERHLVSELIDNINYYLDIPVKLIIYKMNCSRYNSIVDRFCSSIYCFDPDGAINSIGYDDERDNDEDDEKWDYEDVDVDELLNSNEYYQLNILKAKTRYNIHTKYFEELGLKYKDELLKNGIKIINNVNKVENEFDPITCNNIKSNFDPYLFKMEFLGELNNNNISKCLNNSLNDYLVNNTNFDMESKPLIESKTICNFFDRHNLFDIMTKSLNKYNNVLVFIPPMKRNY